MSMKFRCVYAPTETLQSLGIMNQARVQPAELAQPVERLPYKKDVIGSTPVFRMTSKYERVFYE